MAKKEAKKEIAEGKIFIPPINKKYGKLTIVGDSPLMVNQFSEKAKNEINESHQKKAKGPKQARDPRAEFEAAKYLLPNGKYGIPASGLKKCAVRMCSFIEGINMTTAKAAFFVLEESDGLVAIKSSEPVMDERFVRVGTFGNKKPMNRYRPRFDKWECTFSICYDADLISIEQLINLYDRAGFSIGLCELRPEKDGHLGTFHVKRA